MRWPWSDNGGVWTYSPRVWTCMMPAWKHAGNWRFCLLLSSDTDYAESSNGGCTGQRCHGVKSILAYLMTSMAWEEAFGSSCSIDELPILGCQHSADLLRRLGRLSAAFAHGRCGVSDCYVPSDPLVRRSIDVSGIFPDRTWLVVLSRGTASCLAHNTHKDLTCGHFLTESYVNSLFLSISRLVFVFHFRSARWVCGFSQTTLSYTSCAIAEKGALAPDRSPIPNPWLSWQAVEVVVLRARDTDRMITSRMWAGITLALWTSGQCAMPRHYSLCPLSTLVLDPIALK